MRNMKANQLPKWLAYAVFILAIVNFATFVVVAEAIGGDALNGHEAAGRYFLANHGKLTEVSRATFEYSRWHAISVFITHSLAFLVGWKWTRQQKAMRP
jgi:hypothetical protein